MHYEYAGRTGGVGKLTKLTPDASLELKTAVKLTVIRRISPSQHLSLIG